MLAKLLKPRPELRLPLLDVMVHPWVTVQGTSPLVPFTEQPIDEKIQDKVSHWKKKTKYNNTFPKSVAFYFILSGQFSIFRHLELMKENY